LSDCSGQAPATNQELLSNGVLTFMTTLSNLADLRRELLALADAETAAFLQHFFKTGPGQYGEGDRFLGIRVPRLRALVRAGRALALDDVLQLLRSQWHEERLLALLLLVD